MTREHYHQQVLDSTPGRFEGEPDWTPYFWESVMDGFSDATFYEGDSATELFHVTEPDAKLFPELLIGQHVLIWQSNQGFIISRVIEDSELSDIERRYAAMLEAEDL